MKSQIAAQSIDSMRADLDAPTLQAQTWAELPADAKTMLLKVAGLERSRMNKRWDGLAQIERGMIGKAAKQLQHWAEPLARVFA